MNPRRRSLCQKPNPRMEWLERRQLLSGTVGTIVIETSGEHIGQVDVTGTVYSDIISAGTDPNNPQNDYFLIITPGQGTVLQDFPKSQVNGVQIVTDPASPAANPLADNDQVNLAGTTFNGVVGIQGGAGTDTIIGSNGTNVMFGGPGNDLLQGGPGVDTISGEDGNDTIRGGLGDDLLFGDNGDDVLVGGKGNDQLFGNAGNDTLRGGFGDNILGGGGGDDLLIGGIGNNYLEGGANADTLIGGGGNNTVGGGTGADYLCGNWEYFLTYQGDTLNLQNTGADQFYAGAENDTLASSGGADSLTGGGGTNYYAINNLSAVFNDFKAGETAAQSDILTGAATQSLHINLTIQVVQTDGTVKTVDIPSDAGASPIGQSTAAATDSTGDVTFQSSISRVFTLGDFFRHWGVSFDAAGVGQFSTRGGGHHIAMSVTDGTGTHANALFNDYAVQNGDFINIRVTL